jgi:hypothetical protein
MKCIEAEIFAAELPKRLAMQMSHPSWLMRHTPFQTSASQLAVLAKAD